MASNHHVAGGGGGQYLALVLTREGSTQAIELGSAELIDSLIANALKATQAEDPNAIDLWTEVSKKVFAEPLLQLLKNKTSFAIVPDGELNKIPFLALPSPRKANSLLSEEVDLRIVTNGRSLVRQAKDIHHSTQRSLVLADPDFGPAQAGQKTWQRLPGTAKEGLAVARLIKGELYQRAEARPSKLSSISAPFLVHVASHAYFETKAAKRARPSLGINNALSYAFAFEPPLDEAMLASAIVLAGANRNTSPGRGYQDLSFKIQGEFDDGYLTSLEVSRLNLSGTELAVLSACDTTAGVYRTGEGIYGLQRALSVAGAKASLLSLWKVDDSATAYFMERYYTHLVQGKGRMEALMLVQKEFRTKPLIAGWGNYKYWAAWQLVGDTDPISFPRQLPVPNGT